ncbi:MAG: carbohydrate ABC transporter permease [Caldilineaceae bacterium]|nr:carbohydrate ABC transporter permease [Caldilineaceae bacterium]MCB9147871.1 carbohydrate ABC transporter permease [Caldilineaceae bacterium]
MRSKAFRHDLPLHVVLIILGIITFYPLIFTLFTSFKDNSQFYSTFWGPAWPLHWGNYADAWRQLYPVLINTVFVGLVSAFGTIFLASLSAYVFARHRFPGHDLLFYAIIALLMIPGVLTLIPLFLLVKDLGLLNTYWVLILPYIAGGQAFAIFVLRSFIASQPEEIFESARIDGANEFTIYQRIAMPMAKPILGTLAILALLGTWNDYIWPSVTLRNPELWTISLKLVSFSSQWASLQQYGPMFAGYVIASIPLLILFMFTMRLFIEGLASGAIKA